VKKKLFADVEVDEKERKKFFDERLKSIQRPSPDQSPEERAEQEQAISKLADLASVVQDVKKKHRKKK
jgi:hypothetical protein